MSQGEHIPFNRPATTGAELDQIQAAIANDQLSADGEFTARASEWLRAETGAHAVLLTHSCTAALELAVLLADIVPGDEVIMPSFTFVSTANAVALRGGVPVFVDIRPDTLNLNEAEVEAAITPATRAILPVHYAGVACEMDSLCELATAYRLMVIEDAAQGLLSTHHGEALGSIGHLGAISFHETKNVTCGEGGALLVNDERYVERAEIIRDKGTNRKQFFRGEVDKYTWVDLGSSYGLGELAAAFLWAQLTQAMAITEKRRRIWQRYHEAFEELEEEGVLRRPIVPQGSRHNGHLYYILAPDAESRDGLLRELNAVGVNAVFHFVPLHSSPAGQRLGRAHGGLSMTTEMSERLVRLPMWSAMPDEALDRVIQTVRHSATVVRGGLPSPAG
jgi:dTDP-4-amino-4,6-dideoxygalactose transaminase